MPADRPNILVLMSDHTNAQALAPSSPCRTPNLDGLVGGGAVRFGRCYTTNAICSPARASLMTGTYPSTHGMWDCTHTQRRQWVNVSDRLTYWSQPLAAAGYRLGYFGKWHVEQTGRLEDFGWGEYDLSCHAAAPEIVPGSEVRIETPGYRPYRLAAAAADASVPSHPAFDKGIDFLLLRLHGRAARPLPAAAAGPGHVRPGHGAGEPHATRRAGRQARSAAPHAKRLEGPQRRRLADRLRLLLGAKLRPGSRGRPASRRARPSRRGRE